MPAIAQRCRRRQECFGLLVDSVLALQRENKEILWGSMVKETMKRKKPSFNETYYGYRTFSHLLEDAQRKGIVVLRRDQKSGSYIVEDLGPDPARRSRRAAPRRRPRRPRRGRSAAGRDAGGRRDRRPAADCGEARAEARQPPRARPRRRPRSRAALARRRAGLPGRRDRCHDAECSTRDLTTTRASELGADDAHDRLEHERRRAPAATAAIGKRSRGARTSRRRPAASDAEERASVLALLLAAPRFAAGDRGGPAPVEPTPKRDAEGSE